eukprot:403344693
MGPKQQKGKDAKGGKGDKGGKSSASAVNKKAGGKAKKKSWTKVKIKEKLNNAVFLDAKAYERIVKEAPKFQNLTVSIVSDKFKVNGAVARKVLRDLHAKALIKQVGDHHSSFTLYTGTQLKAAEAAPAKKTQAKEAKEAKEAPAKE